MSKKAVVLNVAAGISPLLAFLAIMLFTFADATNDQLMGIGLACVVLVIVIELAALAARYHKFK